ncbi:hypothetical protein DRO50_04250 [Candidatus Bathyarchaeota archaeon]|nr:MAG: hypothetical protein DRO50_04250 [Candidatus Bathyarchaeota archaeon]
MQEKIGWKRLVSEKRWKPLVLKWRTLTELLTLITFFIAAVLVEYAIVQYAFSLGVVERNILSYALTFPGTEWTFTITISPLFHLVPLGAIICLVSSWTYLTRCTAVAPRKTETRQRRPQHTRYREKRGWLKPLRKFGRKLSYGFAKLWTRAKTRLLKTRGVSYLWHKISFARAAIKSAFIVFVVFAAFVFAALFMAFPFLLPKWMMTLYMGNPSFYGFVRGTMSWAQGIACAVPPLGWIASGVNGALRAVAPGFRYVVEGLGSAVAPLAALDATGKYVFLQNFAAWVCCLASLAYGQYVRKYYRRRRFY